MTGNTPTPPLPRIRRGSSWIPSLVWVVPLVAALIGLSLAIHAVRQAGPSITVAFSSAEGIEPGKTKVKYKSVDIGSVTGVHLAKDRSHVLVNIDLVKEADNFAVQDTRFWVVRPRFSGARVSGLGTLLSGPYIGVDGGQSSDRRTEFTGLEAPPVVDIGTPGRHFVLHAADTGSLDVGSPLLFRRLLVGHVESLALSPDGSQIDLEVWIEAPYDRFVTTDTRFWQASGIDLSFGPSGFRLETQSLETILAGGIAFETPESSLESPLAEDGAEFGLKSDRATAMKHHDGPACPIVLNFTESIRGLKVGAPVDFRGVELGEVRSIEMRFDPKTTAFTAPVLVNIYPDRLKAMGISVTSNDEERCAPGALGQLVQHGLRGQLQTGNILSGQLYISLDFFPDAPRVAFNPKGQPMTLPTIPGRLEELQKQVSTILSHLEKVPFAALAADLRRTLTRLESLASRAETNVIPDIQDALKQVSQTMTQLQSGMDPDAPLQQDTREALRNMTEAARSLKTLTDTLERNPEALLRGRQKGQKP